MYLVNELHSSFDLQSVFKFLCQIQRMWISQVCFLCQILWISSFDWFKSYFQTEQKWSSSASCILCKALSENSVMRLRTLFSLAKKQLSAHILDLLNALNIINTLNIWNTIVKSTLKYHRSNSWAFEFSRLLARLNFSPSLIAAATWRPPPAFSKTPTTKELLSPFVFFSLLIQRQNRILHWEKTDTYLI